MPATIDAVSVGTIMPDIALTGSNGEATTLRGVTDGHRAVVFFMRAATCAFCNGHVQTIARMVEAGELTGVAVVIVTPGDANDVAIVAGTLPKGVATVVATGAESRAAVGLTRFMTMLHSGTFVLDTDGRVLAERTAALPTNSFSKSEVLAALAG